MAQRRVVGAAPPQQQPTKQSFAAAQSPATATTSGGLFSRAFKWLDDASLFVCTRCIPLCLWVLPSFVGFELLATPSACFYVCAIACVALAIAAYRNRPAASDDGRTRTRAFKLTLSGSLALAVVVAAYFAFELDGRVLVAAGGALGVAFVCCQALFGAYMGNSMHRQLQEILTTVALFFPLACCCGYVFTFDSLWYTTAVLVSSTASGLNVFFNKELMGGAGVPESRVDRNYAAPQATAAPASAADAQAKRAASLEAMRAAAAAAAAATSNGHDSGAAAAGDEKVAASAFLDMLKKAQPRA